MPEAQINITSMLDIVFCLLIAFMIVAPALKNGVDLELPVVKDAPRYDEKRKPHNIEVRWNTETATSSIYLDGKRRTVDEVTESLKADVLASSARPVLLSSDKRVPWQDVGLVITRLRAAGVGEIGIITERGDSS